PANPSCGTNQCASPCTFPYHTDESHSELLAVALCCIFAWTTAVCLGNSSVRIVWRSFVGFGHKGVALPKPEALSAFLAPTSKRAGVIFRSQSSPANLAKEYLNNPLLAR